MLPFHETLEHLFQKNFSEEILRLPLESAVDVREYSEPISPFAYTPNPFRNNLQHKPSQSSFPEQSVVSSPTRAVPDKSLTTPLSPSASYSPLNGTDSSGRRQQTPLQRHLQHLARYGMTGVSSGPGDRQPLSGSDGHSASSNRESSVNLMNGGGPAHSGVSLSHSASGSLRTALRKFGSLNLGRTLREP